MKQEAHRVDLFDVDKHIYDLRSPTGRTYEECEDLEMRVPPESRGGRAERYEHSLEAWHTGIIGAGERQEDDVPSSRTSDDFQGAEFYDHDDLPNGLDPALRAWLDDEPDDAQLEVPDRDWFLAERALRGLWAEIHYERLRTLTPIEQVAWAREFSGSQRVEAISLLEEVAAERADLLQSLATRIGQTVTTIA